MNNTINISDQNITLAAARNSVAGNNNGYFQLVPFYVASASGNRPNTTGFVVKFDPRLTVLGADRGSVFCQTVYNSEGRPVTAYAVGANKEKAMGDNKFFVTTATDRTYNIDHYLYYARIQFPDNAAVGDVYTIEIMLEDEESNPCEFLFVDSKATAQERADMMAWTKANGVLNGSFTIV